MIEYAQRYDPASPAMLDEVERTVGHRLPAEYREWLAVEGGGVLDGDNTEGVSDILAASLPADDRGSLLRRQGWYDDHPDEDEGGWEPRVAALRPLLIVARDDGGNDFVMPLTGDDAGSVWFVHHECETDGETLYPIEVTRRAGSWTAFLDAIRPLAGS